MFLSGGEKREGPIITSGPDWSCLTVRGWLSGGPTGISSSSWYLQDSRETRRSLRQIPKNLRASGTGDPPRNTPAAYLTGLLFAVKALNTDYQQAILDIGLNRATPGARVFAALKGAVTAGLDIPHGEAVLPDEDRVRGVHIAEYAPDRAGDLVQNVEETIDAIMKELE